MDSLHQALLASNEAMVMVVSDQGVVEGANKAMCDLLGISNHDLSRADIFTLFPQERSDKYRSYLNKALETGQAVRFDEVSSCDTLLHGQIRFVSDKRALIVLCKSEDSANKKAEEERFCLAAAIEQAAEAVVILDNDLHIRYVNQAFETMTGYSQQEAKGHDIAMLFQGEAQEKVLENVVGCLKHGESWAGRTANTRKDGSLFTCQQTVSRIRGKRFASMGYVAIWRDVTEVMELERRLRHAQKMEAVGTLAGGIAHDFNNILGPIMLHAELALERLDNLGADPAKTESWRESLLEIVHSADRGRMLADRILGLSRRREMESPVLFHLSHIVKECLAILRPTLSPGITARFSSDTTSDVILADPTQLHQVVMNLCANAAQAMEEEPGMLTITISERFMGPCELKVFPELSQGDYIILTVEDTGKGIESEDLDRVFDPFFTTKMESQGTGLGLSMVHTIVTNLGGAVRVDPQRVKGAAFNVLLPKQDSQVMVEERGLCSGREHKTRIMLVDDDEVLANGLQNILQQLNCCVTRCGNGYEALALFRQDPDRFDLVMVDLATPEMDGMRLARELKLSRTDLPVVILSGYTEILPPGRAGSLGVWAFLRKPCRYEELKSVLEGLSGRHQQEELGANYGQCPDN